MGFWHVCVFGVSRVSSDGFLATDKVIVATKLYQSHLSTTLFSKKNSSHMRKMKHFATQITNFHCEKSFSNHQ
jgi:hypothetical protein